MRSLHKYKSSLLIMLALLLPLGIGTAYGAFPEKAITIVVHAGPGGGSDLFARTLAAGIEKYQLLPQPIVVENKPGGSGAVSFAYVVGKKKDPYYLVTTTGVFITTPLQRKTAFNYKDFTPLCNFMFDEHMWITHANSKFKTLKDLITFAKANPQKATVGGSMLGGAESITTYNLEKAAGIKLNFVTFTGSGEMMAQVLGGHVDLALANPCEAMELAKANKVIILGLAAEKPYSDAPEVLTLKQQGVDAIGAGMNRGLAAPGDIPEDARKILEGAFFKLTQTEMYQKYTKDNMLTDAWMDGSTYAKWLDERNKKMTVILKDMGVIK